MGGRACPTNTCVDGAQPHRAATDTMTETDTMTDKDTRDIVYLLSFLRHITAETSASRDAIP
jgi:hypothetical protein